MALKAEFFEERGRGGSKSRVGRGNWPESQRSQAKQHSRRSQLSTNGTHRSILLKTLSMAQFAAEDQIFWRYPRNVTHAEVEILRPDPV